MKVLVSNRSLVKVSINLTEWAWPEHSFPNPFNFYFLGLARNRVLENIMNKKPRILVAENDENNFLLIEKSLVQHGLAAQCVWLSNPAKITQTLSEGVWDAILIGHNSPEKAFKNVLAAIKQAALDIPVILLTDVMEADIALKWMKGGICDGIFKSSLAHVPQVLQRDLVESREGQTQLTGEEALCMKEARMRRITDCLPGNAPFLEDNPHYRYIDPGDEHWFQRPRTLANGHSVKDMLGPTGYNVIRAHLDAMLAGAAQPYEQEESYPSPWARYIHATLAPGFDEASAAKHAVAMISEITQHKALGERQRLAAAVFANSQDGICVTDAKGRILVVNPAFASITRYEEKDVLGKHISKFHADIHESAIYSQWRDALESTGVCRGEIVARRKTGELFPAWLSVSVIRDDKEKITSYVGTITDLSQLSLATQRLEYLAQHDVLTGLSNRSLLLSRLSHALYQAQRQDIPLAVISIGLDGFNYINDSHGHQAGDDLLRLVAQRMEGRVRHGDMLARSGGDEFLLTLQRVRTAADALCAAHAFLEILDAPFTLHTGETIHIGACMGVSVFPFHGDQPEQLVQYAETALSMAKKHGRGSVQLYAEQQTHDARQFLSMEAGLRRGLESDQFVLYYQPLVRLEDGRVVGMEALVRWRDPNAGLVSPSHFIPLAEETGLILAIGEWVLREACTQMKSWLDDGIALNSIAVNLSPRQFRLPDIVKRVEAILRETGLPAHYLEVEITEGNLMEPGAELEAKLDALSALGVRITIDDFGTGYSSLAYLKRFPIHKLKIDQRFVRDIPNDPADMAISATVVAMARNLNFQCLAEGTERQEQVDFLLREGCTYGQGYWFSPPLPAAQATQILKQADCQAKP